jgi:uncharacterized peroxidase-related enzyme
MESPVSYIPALPRDAVPAAIGASLDAVQKKLGVLPNMFRVFAHSKVALEAYLQLADVAAHGRLDARQREQIALAVGGANGCDYCVAAHGAIGRMVGLRPDQIAQAREAHADTPRDEALLRLARRIVEARGHVPVAELDAFKAAGYDDAAILEVLVNVMLNVYTNYTNHLARTEIDFPLPAATRAA